MPAMAAGSVEAAGDGGNDPVSHRDSAAGNLELGPPDDLVEHLGRIQLVTATEEISWLPTHAGSWFATAATSNPSTGWFSAGPLWSWLLWGTGGQAMATLQSPVYQELHSSR
jgi:hypothetical protein